MAVLFLDQNQTGPAHRQVAFLGPTGTYTHEACLRRFDGSEFILRPYPTIPDTVYALLSTEDPTDEPQSASQIWAAVVPIKNSTAGPVLETEKVLSEPEVNRQILRSKEEIVLKIEHCLVGSTLSNPKNCEVVASHTQALQQCNEYLNEHYPNLRRIETSSTSQAASLAAHDTNHKTLAICSPMCASTYNSLKVLDHQIQDAGLGTHLLRQSTYQVLSIRFKI